MTKQENTLKQKRGLTLKDQTPLSPFEAELLVTDLNRIQQRSEYLKTHLQSGISHLDRDTINMIKALFQDIALFKKDIKNIES